MQQRTSNQGATRKRDWNVNQLSLLARDSGSSMNGGFLNLTSRNSSAGPVEYTPSQFRSTRPSLNGDLFVSFKEELRKEEVHFDSNQGTLLKERYDKESLEYARYLFDDRIRLIIRRIAIKAYSFYRDKEQHSFLSFSIEKMLSILAKKLLLNRFELLFFQYVLEETKWKYDLDAIVKNTHHFKSFMNANEQEDEDKLFKQVETYFLYCGYYSKKSLNELPNENIYNCFLRSVCPNFKERFQEWTQGSNVANIKISPKNLNNIFKRLTFHSDRDRQEIENYSLTVQEIIDISPAYNADKSVSKIRKTKKRKTGHASQQQREYIREPISAILKEQEEDIQLPIMKQESDFELADIPSLRNKKQTSFMSIVDGMDPQAYYRNNCQ